MEKEPHLPTGRGCLYPEFRILLVEDAAYRSTCSGADAVFIVDDFIATGKTLSLAATAILDREPATNVYGLALAKPEWHSLMLNWYDFDVSNDHIPAQWDGIWLSGGLDTRSDPTEKRRIRMTESRPC